MDPPPPPVDGPRSPAVTVAPEPVHSKRVRGKGKVKEGVDEPAGRPGPVTWDAVL